MLVNPAEKYGNSWLSALQEFEAEDLRGFWSRVEDPADVPALVKRLYEISEGINIPNSWVPATTLWYVEGECYIGHIDIRHRLNLFLEQFGGHIGYAVRPTERRNGYGYRMLEAALPIIKEIGLNEILITCDKGNIASRKIIERNGGRFENELTDDEGTVKLRYWICL
ncbi:MAG: GNAT family N-acetyltransferase [Saprospiraceae bacterium]|nr:GNAT family N-acetyltransferase [Saprospiraceae bacterium]